MAQLNPSPCWPGGVEDRLAGIAAELRVLAETEPRRQGELLSLAGWLDDMVRGESLVH
jgi:hypothetical protein